MCDWERMRAGGGDQADPECDREWLQNREGGGAEQLHRHGWISDRRRVSLVLFRCKISNSVVGPNCLIKANSIVNFCQFAMGCVVEKGSNIEK